ncbi:myomodulin neuropeptides 2 [Patella vulgata]|uniref:myomodulin neuropeptides 2 n=1 Tax=Patella vulgata TaxID=6465 RepID=UPI002180943D|nr:myomodulin neuropeptides 2 [Patella vulgata]
MIVLSNFLAVGLVFFLNLGLSRVICDKSSNNELSRVRRGGWSMLRLGRGLQMLRLGKRTQPMMSQDDVLDALKSALYDQEKNFNSRQVPLPRYGKDLEWQNYLDKKILGDTVGDEEKRESALPVDSLIAEAVDGYRRPRPAPRGGRFRRSAHYPDELQSNSIQRAVALPRFGRFIENQIKNTEGKERAVPAPRFGRST